VPVTNKSLLNQ